jgi:phytoene desaturase
MSKVIVIGSGVSGLASAAFLAKQGHDVTILEKNKLVGGRARQYTHDGFVFDMGPSWYWMPEVFENFYKKFGYTTADFYDLKRVDPSYRVFWKDNELTDVPANYQELLDLFESIEKGSASKLDKFLKEAQYKYEVGMNDLVFKPGVSLLEFADRRVMAGLFKLQLFSSFDKHIRAHFTHPKLLSLLEFPILFLGATAKETPALYSLMNYADLKLGTWYPMGGMYKIIEAFQRIAEEQGVKILTDCEVTGFNYNAKRVDSVKTVQGDFDCDIVVSSADYAHTDDLLNGKANYDKKYWDKRTMAPSSLLFYLGIDKKIDGLHHHNLFFDEDFAVHAYEIYKDPKWPSKPLFYACCPSKSDPSVAPEGKENLFILIPIAPDLKDDQSMHDKYFDMVMDKLEERTGTQIRDAIVYKRSYSLDDFKKDYHAFKGNAYGLANTLRQTAILKPKLKHKKLSNFYYTGQLTTPGPGLPPAIISGEVVAGQIELSLKHH